MINYRINLPKIEDNLDQETKLHREKYKKVYFNLIEKCCQMTEKDMSGYNEVHHIIPRCLGGNNDNENLILMPIRYHVFAHILLFEIYPNVKGLAFAVSLMLGKYKNSVRISSKFAAIEISKAKTFLLKERAKKVVDGEGNTYSSINEASRKTGICVSSIISWVNGRTLESYGWHYLDENDQIKSIIKRPSEKKKKKVIHEDKIFDSVEEAHIVSGISKSTLIKYLREESHGWKYLNPKDKLKTKKITFYDKIGGNPRAKRVIGPNGLIYKSVKDAASAAGINPATMRDRLTGNTLIDYGWYFIDEKDNPIIPKRIQKKEPKLRTRGNSPAAKKIKNSEGKVFDCIADAAEYAGISYVTMSRWIKRNTPKNHGWSYYK